LKGHIVYKTGSNDNGVEREGGKSKSKVAGGTVNRKDSRALCLSGGETEIPHDSENLLHSAPATRKVFGCPNEEG